MLTFVMRAVHSTANFVIVPCTCSPTAFGEERTFVCALTNNGGLEGERSEISSHQSTVVSLQYQK